MEKLWEQNTRDPFWGNAMDAIEELETELYGKDIDFRTFCIQGLKNFMEYEPLDFVDLAPVHFDWIDAMNKHDRVAIIAFRESMKSTLALVHAAYKMVTVPNTRLMLGSSNMTKASRRLHWFDEFCQRNPRLRRMIDGNRWSSQVKFFKNGSRIMASAVAVAMEGERVHGAILDDVLEEFQRFSDANVIHWMTQVVVPFLLPNGWIWMLQTQKRPEDITDWVGTNPAWHRIRQPVVDENDKPVWPQYWSQERIDSRKREMPMREFESEYMLNCINDEAAVIPWNVLQRNIDSSATLEGYDNNWECVMGVDLAVGLDTANDETAYTLVAWNRDTKQRRLIHTWSGKVQGEGSGWLKAQVDNIVALNDEFRPRKIMIESNGFQRLVAHAASEVRGLPIAMHNTGSEKHHSAKGIPAIGYNMEQDRYLIPYPDNNTHVKKLVQGLRRLTWGLNGKLDGHVSDSVISLWMCELAIREFERKRISVTSWDNSIL